MFKAKAALIPASTTPLLRTGRDAWERPVNHVGIGIWIPHQNEQMKARNFRVGILLHMDL